MPVYPDSNSLDYINRDVLLGRWMLPVSREADSTISAEEETEVDVLDETVLEELEPEPGLGNVDPMSPQRTLLWRERLG